MKLKNERGSGRNRQDGRPNGRRRDEHGPADGKLMAQNNMAATETMQQSTQPAPQPVPAASNPQMQQARPQPQAAVPHEVKKLSK